MHVEFRKRNSMMNNARFIENYLKYGIHKE